MKRPVRYITIPQEEPSLLPMIVLLAVVMLVSFVSGWICGSASARAKRSDLASQGAVAAPGNALGLPSTNYVQISNAAK